MITIKAGDIVKATGRDPMPEAMKEAFKTTQVVKVADHPFYEFESGWSVNVDQGDSIFLVTPFTGKVGNRKFRRRIDSIYRRHPEKFNQ